MEKIALVLRKPIVTVKIRELRPTPSSKPATENAKAAVAAPVLDREAVYREGFQQGHQEATRLGQIQLQTLSPLLESVSAQLSQMTRDYLGQLEPQIVQLALAVAEGLLHREIREGRYDIAAIVRKILLEVQNTPGLEMVTALCHPEDLAVLQQSSLPLPHLQWLADAAVPRAGVILKTNLGEISTSLESQWQRLGKTFLETREKIL